MEPKQRLIKACIHQYIRTILNRISFLILGLLTATTSTLAQAGSLRIDSWRIDDQILWNTRILPLFHAAHPNIHVTFVGINPTQYDSILNTNLFNKTAADLIACRPFATSLRLFQNGHLVDLTNKINLKAFRSITKVAWSTQNGKFTYCLPLAAVTNGFFYDKKIFEELKLDVPESEEQFFNILDSIKRHDQYTPIALGTEDQWESAQVALASIGPNEWKGEIGRRALINKKAKMTDQQFVRAWEKLAQLKPYLAPNHQSMNYDEARRLFTSGRAATFLSGSWNAAYLENIDPNRYGIFRYPTRQVGGECFVTHHMDMGIGINAASTNQEDAIVFLQWLTTQEFSEAFANSISGFIPLSSHAISINSPLANDIYQWRKECKTTIRINSQYLDNGPQPLEHLLWEVSAGVINHTVSPSEATKIIHENLEQWFYKK
jgi:raffinose/stachyose/melibiose transport system substrate-binding protein